MGLGIIWHIRQLDQQNLQELTNLNDKRASRPVSQPEGVSNNMKVAYTCDEVHYWLIPAHPFRYIEANQ